MRAPTPPAAPFDPPQACKRAPPSTAHSYKRASRAAPEFFRFEPAGNPRSWLFIAAFMGVIGHPLSGQAARRLRFPTGLRHVPLRLEPRLVARVNPGSADLLLGSAGKIPASSWYANWRASP